MDGADHGDVLFLGELPGTLARQESRVDMDDIQSGCPDPGLEGRIEEGVAPGIIVVLEHQGFAADHFIGKALVVVGRGTLDSRSKYGHFTFAGKSGGVCIDYLDDTVNDGKESI
jgi:hypothetical protein